MQETTANLKPHNRVEKQAGESVWVKITLTQFTTVGNADCKGGLIIQMVVSKITIWVK